MGLHYIKPPFLVEKISPWSPLESHPDTSPGVRGRLQFRVGLDGVGGCGVPGALTPGFYHQKYPKVGKHGKLGMVMDGGSYCFTNIIYFLQHILRISILQLQWFAVVYYTTLYYYMTSWTLLESYRKNLWCFYFSGPGRRSHGASGLRPGDTPSAPPEPRTPELPLSRRVAPTARGGKDEAPGEGSTVGQWGDLKFWKHSMVVSNTKNGDFGGSRPIFGKHPNRI